MGCRQLGFSLLILLCLINFASSSPMQKTLPSEFMQKIKLEDKVIYGSKTEAGSSHHGGNGGNTQGGTAVPVIVGGAANNNRNHQNRHSAANCNLNRISFATLLIITLVSPLIQLLLLD